MADYVIGRAVSLSGGSFSSQRPKNWVPGRGWVECPKCKQGVLEIWRDGSKPDKCSRCGADLSEWPDTVADK